MDKTIKIAVTGGIGSGKSLAIKALSDSGYSTVSCDEIAKNLYDKMEVRAKLKLLFPNAVSKDLSFVDRKAISDEVFCDKAKLKALNDLTHPLIVKEAIELAETNGGLNFIEVPLLFEGGFEKLFDGVLVVKRSKEKRIESVKLRSSLSEEEIVARMNNQVDYDNLDLSETTVIFNDGSPDELKQTVLDIAKKMKTP